MSEPVQPVLFRVDRGGVFALFPCIAGTNNPATCTSYQHTGQHSSADLIGTIQATRPAKPAEFLPLKRELERIGYRLTVARVTPPSALAMRRAQIERGDK